MEQYSLEMIDALRKESTNEQLIEQYEATNGGWFKENTGPLALRDSVDRPLGEHETQSIYRFAEGFAKYDLSLQLAIKSKEMPEF